MVVSVSNGVLKIDGFATSKGDIVSYFAELPDSEDKGEKLETLLQLGILAQSSAGTVIGTQYVETAFNSLKEKMDRNIADAFGSNGDFERRLKEYFGEGGTVKGMLDPDRPDTPLNKLRTTLHDEISKIKEVIATQKGYSEAAKKGTQKGREFEERCVDYICDAAKPYSDTVEATGESAGDMSAQKKGDSVVTIDGTEKRFVLEMKYHTGRLTLPVIRKLLEESMKNRRADYGVLVSRNRDALPKEVGWFNEYDGNKLVCALSENDGEEENVWVLTTACRWARLRMTSDSDGDLDIDPDVITKGINKIEASLKRMQRVTTKCSSISKAAGEIEELMKEEKGKIKDEIDSILHSLKRQGGLVPKAQG